MSSSTRTFLLLCTLLLSSLSVRGQQIVEDVGHGVQLGLPIAALGVSVLEKDYKGALQLTKTVAVESVAIYALKRIANRKRPNGKNNSFPSGHTAVSFASSTYLWKRYGWKYGVPATVLASFVGYSRFGTDKPVHYLSDVIAGASIGILTAYTITKSKLKDKQLEVSALARNGSYGLSAQLTF